MITAHGLTRFYGETLAVENVSFSISPGEIVGLLGHNGAGKSTILKLITGALEPDEGKVLLDGENMDPDSQDAKSKIGYLPENLPLYMDMQVVDYLDYMASVRGLTGETARDAVVRSMRTTELTARAFERIDQLSRGFRQRVGVAQAILHDPKYVILDEPTNGLDPSQTLAMRHLLERLSKNAAVLVSTHVLQEVNAICDRVLILRDGKLAVDQPLDALKSSSRLSMVTTAMQEDVTRLLGAFNWIRAVTPHEDASGYFLELADESLVDDQPRLASLLRELVSGGIPISEMSRERRDLETLFREVTEARHAA